MCQALYNGEQDRNSVRVDSYSIVGEAVGQNSMQSVSAQRKWVRVSKLLGMNSDAKEASLRRRFK